MLRLLLLPTTITLLLAGLIGAAIAAGRALDASTILAYVSYVGGDQEIHIMDLHRAVSINVTRSPEQDSTPAWSPDGRRIAFVSQRDRNYEIYMLDLTTGRSVNLSNSRDTVDREAAWSAGGTLVAFTTLVASGRDVSIVDLATGDKRVLLPDSDMADAMPQWSPDGRHIAFQTYERGQWRVEIMDFETGDIWRVSEDAVPGLRGRGWRGCEQHLHRRCCRADGSAHDLLLAERSRSGMVAGRHTHRVYRQPIHRAGGHLGVDSGRHGPGTAVNRRAGCGQRAVVVAGWRVDRLLLGPGRHTGNARHLPHPARRQRPA
jgi:hypothetical protein